MSPNIKLSMKTNTKKKNTQKQSFVSTLMSTKIMLGNTQIQRLYSKLDRKEKKVSKKNCELSFFMQPIQKE